MGKVSPLLEWRKTTCAPESPLTPTERLVCSVIANDMKRLTCWPGRTRIAACAGLSVRAVEKAIRRIEEAGFLHVERGGACKDGARRSSRYTATLPTGEPRSLVHIGDWRISRPRPANLTTSTGEPRSPEGVVEGDKEGVSASQGPSPKLREMIEDLARRKAMS